MFSIVLRYRGLNEILAWITRARTARRGVARRQRASVFIRVKLAKRTKERDGETTTIKRDGDWARGEVVLEIQRQPLLFFIHMYEISKTFLFSAHFSSMYLVPST